MNAASHRLSTTRCTGIGLIELLVGVAILSILATIAVPSFTDSIERRRIEGLAVAVSTDLQFARAEAMKRNRNVNIAFTSSGHTITVPGTTPITVKTVSYADYGNVTVSVSDVMATTTFSPRLGSPVATPGATDGVTVSGSGGRSLRVSVNAIGRVSICGTFGGYPSCPSS